MLLLQIKKTDKAAAVIKKKHSIKITSTIMSKFSEKKILFNVIYTALHALYSISHLYSKTNKKRPTFSVLIQEDIFIIEHTVTYSLLHKTVIFHHSEGFFTILQAI